MKIALWNTNYFRKFGGAEKAVHNLLNRFSHLGIETFLIAGRINNDQRSNEFFEPLNPSVKIYQDTFTNPWDHLNRPVLFVSKLIQYIRAAIRLAVFLSREKIPLIHIHYVSWDILLLAFYKILFRYRLIVTFRAGEEEVSRHLRLSKFKIRIALKFADSVTTVCKELSKRLYKNYGYAKALYLSNGVDVEHLWKTARSSSFNIKGDQFIFCGRFSAQKRVPFLVEAFCEAIQKGCRQNLYLIGEGEEFERVRKLIATYKLNQSVILVGPLHHSETLAAIQQSRCLLLSSIFEGMPQVILEAMAFAKPVISSNVGGVEDLVLHGQNGFLYPPERKDVFSDLIVQISSNQTKASQLGSRGSEIVSSKFDLDAIVLKYLELYRSVGVEYKPALNRSKKNQESKEFEKCESLVFRP